LTLFVGSSHIKIRPRCVWWNVEPYSTSIDAFTAIPVRYSEDLLGVRVSTAYVENSGPESIILHGLYVGKDVICAKPTWGRGHHTMPSPSNMPLWVSTV